MDKNKTIRVLVMHRQEILRIGVAALLEREHDIKVVAETSCLSDALAFFEQMEVDVVLLDAHMDSSKNFSFISQLINNQVKRKVLLMPTIDDPDSHRRGLQEGASGVFTVNQTASALPKAIRRIHAGELWIDRETTSVLFNEMRSKTNALPENKLNALTARQYRVAGLAAQGYPAKKIAASLNISDKTVRNQLVQVYSKLGVSGRIELALKAAQFGLQPEQSPAV